MDNLTTFDDHDGIEFDQYDPRNTDNTKVRPTTGIECYAVNTLHHATYYAPVIDSRYDKPVEFKEDAATFKENAIKLNH